MLLVIESCVKRRRSNFGVDGVWVFRVGDLRSENVQVPGHHTPSAGDVLLHTITSWLRIVRRTQSIIMQNRSASVSRVILCLSYSNVLIFFVLDKQHI